MAGYISKNLQPGETIEFRGRVTRLILLPSLFMVVAAIVALVPLHSASNSPGMDLVRAVVIIALVFYLLRVVFGFLAIRSAEYAVTDRRIIGKRGVIRRRAVDILMTQVSGIQVKQGLFARIFGYGALDVLAAGVHQDLPYLKKPLRFRAAIYERLESSRLLKGTAAYTLDVRSVPGDPVPAPAPAAPTPAPAPAAPAPAPAPAAPAPAPAAPAPAPAPAPPTPAPADPTPAPADPLSPVLAPSRAGVPNLPPNTPAHWAPDPFGRGVLRFWDGTSWTEHVSEGLQTP